MNEITKPNLIKSRVNRQIILVFALLFFSYAYFYQGGHGNYAPQFALIRSIIERHRLDVGGYPTGADIIVYKGKLYSNKAPGNALIGILPFYVFSKLMSLLKLPLWLAEHLVVYLTTIFTTSLFSVLIGLLLYLILLKITGDALTSLITSLSYGLATIAFPFATMFFSHQTASFFCFTSFFILLKVSDAITSALKTPFLLLAGFLAGYAVVIEHPTFLIALLLGIYLFWKLNRKINIAFFVIGGLLAVAIFVVFNLLAYDKPFFISYQAYATPGRSAFVEHKLGFLGITYPRLAVLWRITFGEQRGLFFFNPILLCAFPGLIFLWSLRRFRKEFWLILAIIILYFSFNAAYGESIAFWGGGASTGPRHIIPMLPFAMIPVGLFFNRAKGLFYLFFLPSFFFMLLATAINPVLEYQYSNPVFQFLIPYFLQGELAIQQYGTFNNTFITENSVAFNLGGLLLGIKGTLSLLPLAGAWIAIGWLILSDLVSNQLLQRYTRHILIVGVFLVLITIIFFPLLHQSYEKRFIISPQHSGLIGYYYKGERWEGNPEIVKRDQQIYFPWVWKTLPLKPPFCVEWKGKIIVPNDGIYSFATESDDGSWLYIDGKLIVDNGGIHAAIFKQGQCQLTKGKHTLLLRYINNQGDGSVKLFWTRPGRSKEVISKNFLAVH